MELKKIIKKLNIYILTYTIMLTSGCSLKRKSVTGVITPTKKIESTTPIPTEAVPATPIPTEAIPTIPIPTEAVPATPIPTEAIPTIPIPTKAIPATPIPTEAIPTTPIPTEAVPVISPNITIKNNGQYIKINNFNILNQDKYPTGCESVSAVMCLQHLGYKINVDEFIDNYLDKIPVNNDYYENPDNEFKNIYNDYFLGNPRSELGKACNAPVIQKAITKYFDKIGEDNLTCNLYTGSKFEDLYKKLEEGKAVIIWVTMDLKEPSRYYYMGGHQIYVNRHTCVLIGVDKEKNVALIAEPMSGKLKEWNLDKVIYYYNLMGCQAAVIESKSINYNDTLEAKGLTK